MTTMGIGYVETLINVSNNLAVLTCGIAAFCWARRSIGRNSAWTRLAVEALILSALALYTMNNSLETSPGRYYDARFIVLTIACVVSGNRVGFIVMLAIILMRIEMGGMGMWPGLSDAVTVFILASAYGAWVRHRARPIAYRDLVVLGLMASLATSGGWFLLPWEQMAANWANPDLTLGLLSGNEIGMLILGTLIMRDNRLRTLQRGMADRGAKFYDIVDNLPVSFAMSDRNATVRFLNRRFLERYGEDFVRFIGQDADQLRSYIYSGEQLKQSLAAERAAIVTGKPQNRYLTDFMINGRPVSLWLTLFSMRDAKGRPDGAAVIGVDVSDLRQREKENERLREQLRDAGKMKAIGQLAGGIAHDFNNLLGAMYGFATFLDEDLADQKTERVYAKRILALLDHAKMLVSQVLTFARTDRVERDRIDLCGLFSETADLLRSSLPQSTNLTLTLPPEPVYLAVNEAQIRQLLITVTLNCAQNLVERSGAITIALDRLVAGSAELEPPKAAQVNRHVVGTLKTGGRYVRITVADDGPGMEQEVVERLVEPFFTALNHGDRSGLGLSIVLGIIAAYGGAYAVTTRPGHGTAFNFYFPANEAAVICD